MTLDLSASRDCFTSPDSPSSEMVEQTIDVSIAFLPAIFPLACSMRHF